MEKQHFIALDGLRGVAALCVLAYHASGYVPPPEVPMGGYLAVDFFFMLSGFVVDYAYAERLRSGMSVVNFLKVRAIRLYPLIVLGAMLGLITVVAGRLLITAGRFKIAAAFPFALVALPSPPFIDSDPFIINRPAWSLFFEIVANIVFAMGLFKLSARWLAVGACLLAIPYAWISIATGNVNHGAFTDGYFSFGFVRVAFCFAVGMVLNRIAQRRRALSGMPFWMVSLLLVASLCAVPWETRTVCELTIVFVVFPILILGAQRSNPSLRWAAIARFSGFISYPLYILHYPLYQLCDIVAVRLHVSAHVWLPVATATILVISYLAGKADRQVRAWSMSRMNRLRFTTPIVFAPIEAETMSVSRELSTLPASRVIYPFGSLVTDDLEYQPSQPIYISASRLRTFLARVVHRLKRTFSTPQPTESTPPASSTRTPR